ncbi:DUF4352 domain-containing protein [Nocardia rhizosphaerae]|uniref:DUF4352 domain-containing protein n=1 Tax=Nocardia rhizosphaerae TaxID=1691571 RepID=A0ABV8LE53_9NOCA
MTYPPPPQGQPRPYRAPAPPQSSTNRVVTILAIGFACLVIFGIVAAVVATQGNSGDAADSSATTVTYSTPPTDTSGDLEFAVLKVTTGQSKVGSNTADGEYISVTVKVTNVGKAAEGFDPGSPYVFDAQDRMYSADDKTTGRGDVELNPGMSVTKTVYYDVPPGTKPTVFSASEGLGVPFARINLPPQG